MSRVVTQFLVNGGPGSAAGERAERIAAEVDGRTEISYRTGARRGDIGRMAAAVRRNKPAIVYSMDLAIAPVTAWALSDRGGSLMVDTGDTPRAFLDLIGASWPAKRMADILERVGYGRSRRIVVRGAYHAEQLHDVGYHHVSVIPDGVDTDLFRPHVVDDLRSQLGLDSRLTVGVQGNFTWFPQLGGGLGWDLVEAIGRHSLDIDAVFIGDGPGLSHLRVLANRHGIADRIHVMGRVSYNRLAQYLSLCDVTLLTQTDDPSSWARTTGKLPTYLATGRHIIASRVGSAADVLPADHLLEYRGKWDDTYPDRLARRLSDLAADRAETRRSGLELRDLSSRYEYGSIARACADQISAIIDTTPAGAR
ncbi:MAG: glycosyltransferase family 4 protein [Actinomycetia bacterium]|nr:glycosyltransferase family 4 protein [Actinomycetes bacterium]MCP4960998.1 glycosyltransferase family 4 protein [Actinomycetes bacterium]